MVWPCWFKLFFKENVPSETSYYWTYPEPFWEYEIAENKWEAYDRITNRIIEGQLFGARDFTVSYKTYFICMHLTGSLASGRRSVTLNHGQWSAGTLKQIKQKCNLWMLRFFPPGIVSRWRMPCDRLYQFNTNKAIIKWNNTSEKDSSNCSAKSKGFWSTNWRRKRVWRPWQM